MSNQSETEPGVRELQGLIQSVVRNPEAYVGSQRFDDVAAFIGGYAFASSEMYDELREFNRWLVGRLGFPKNLVWVSGIRLVYPVSEEALRELGALFDEFKQSTTAA